MDDVVIESPAPGSSGAELEVVDRIVQAAPHKFYVVSARAVKNMYGKGTLTDAESAEAIYKIATEHPARLRLWRLQERLERKYTSVRPYDKRGYDDPQVDAWLSILPSPDQLTGTLRELFVQGKKKLKFARARVLPLAMAMHEPAAVDRKSYEKVIGLYDHGFPSFYRRATIALMQTIAKRGTGKTKMAEITREERKEAWRSTRRSIRELYSLRITPQPA